MAIAIRIMAVLGAIWSLIVLGFVTTVGSLVSWLGLYDRTDTNEFVFNVISLEIVLLCTLWQAGKLNLRAAPVLLLWFVAFSALIDIPFVWREWPEHLLGTMIYLSPVTLTLLLLTLHGVVEHFKARRNRLPEVPALPPLPPLPVIPAR